MSLTLDITDYDDYTYTIDTSDNIQMTNFENVGYKKVDLSKNIMIKKAPLDLSLIHI